MSLGLNDPKLQRALSLALADVARQGVSKESIQAKKALAVGGGSLVGAYTVQPWIQSMVNSWGAALSPELSIMLGEVLSVASALYLLESMDVITPGDAAVSSDKGGKFMKAVKLAGYDVLVAYIIQMLMGASGVDLLADNYNTASQ